jgi:protein tyrosine phosphatase
MWNLKNCNFPLVSDCENGDGNTQLSDYKSELRDSVNQLGSGNIIIHCAVGVGRTGTFALILLRKVTLSQKYLDVAGSYYNNVQIL